MLREHRPTTIVTAGLIVLQAVALTFASVMLFPQVAAWHFGDLALYYNNSVKVLHGLTPYRDFPIEYPPFALLAFMLPHVASLTHPLLFSEYAQAFLVENVLLSTLIAFTVAWLAARRSAMRAPALTLALYALAVALGAPLLPWRYDLFPAALTALALVCVVRERPAWAGIWAGLGVAAKLYPVVLLPIFGLYYLAAGDRRALLRLGLGSLVALLLAIIPFLYLSTTPSELLAFLGYHRLRGLQIETLPAGLIMVALKRGLTTGQIVFNYGALHFDSPWSTVALALLPFVFIATFGVVAGGAWGRFREEGAMSVDRRATVETLAAYTFAALLAFIVTNKVFSPQYMAWLLPFAPLLRPRQMLAFLAILVMTVVIFPFAYNQLIALQKVPVILLNVRNMLSALLLAWVVIDRRPASLRSILPWRLIARQPARA